MTSQEKLEAVRKAIAEGAGARPSYFADPDVDRLLGIVMATAGEVAVTVERLDTLERVLNEKGLLTVDELADYQPDDGVVAERMAWHQAFVARILRVVEQELEATRAS